MNPSALIPQTIVVANVRIDLPASLIAFTVEMKKVKKYAAKLSTGPNLYELLFLAN